MMLLPDILTLTHGLESTITDRNWIKRLDTDWKILHHHNVRLVARPSNRLIRDSELHLCKTASNWINFCKTSCCLAPHSTPFGLSMPLTLNIALRGLDSADSSLPTPAVPDFASNPAPYLVLDLDLAFNLAPDLTGAHALPRPRHMLYSATLYRGPPKGGFRSDSTLLPFTNSQRLQPWSSPIPWSGLVSLLSSPTSNYLYSMAAMPFSWSDLVSLLSRPTSNYLYSMAAMPFSSTLTKPTFPPGLSLNKWMHIYMGNIEKRWTNGLNIANWNCGSGYLTKGKKFEVELFLKSNNIDLMAVSEVDICNTSFYYDAQFAIKGYTLVFPPSWNNIGRTRILLYIKKSLESHTKLRPDLSPPNQPIIWVQINTNPHFLVSFFYREWTDWKGDKSATGQAQRLTEIIDKARSTSSQETIWTGDFNIQEERLTSTEEDTLSSKLKEYMLEEGLEQLVKEKTRERVVNGNLQQSTIDLILSSKKENIKHINVHKTSNSDHSIVSFTRMTPQTLKPDPITVRNFKDFKEEAFVEDLANMNWFLEDKEIDVAVAAVTETILHCLDIHAPWSTFTPRTKSNPLISNETIRWIRLRDKADEKAKRTKDSEDLKAWRKLRNKVVGMITKDKKRADSLNFSSTKNAWSAYNALKRQKNSKNGPPQKLKIDGKEITDEKQMAEEFNSFFISKVDKLKEKITSVNQPYDPVLHLKNLSPMTSLSSAWNLSQRHK